MLLHIPLRIVQHIVLHIVLHIELYSIQHTSEEFDTWWYQDNEHKRIVHRIDDVHTMFVTEGYSFYVTQQEFRGEVEVINTAMLHTVIDHLS